MYGNLPLNKLSSVLPSCSRISLYVEIYLYFFVVFKICMYTILVLLFLSFYTFVDVHIIYAHIRMCTFHKNNIAIYSTIQMQNQVEKARIFVSRSYQIKDNTVYYKLYFGMIWHQDSGDLIRPLSALTFTYQMTHNLYWKGNIQYQNTRRQYNAGLLVFFAETNLSENTYYTYILFIYIH